MGNGLKNAIFEKRPQNRTIAPWKGLKTAVFICLRARRGLRVPFWSSEIGNFRCKTMRSPERRSCRSRRRRARLEPSGAFRSHQIDHFRCKTGSETSLGAGREPSDPSSARVGSARLGLAQSPFRGCQIGHFRCKMASEIEAESRPGKLGADQAAVNRR